MLRNIKEYLASHEGLNFFDIFPLILFTVLFILILIYVFGLSKQHIDEIEKYPLNDQNDLDYGKKE
jgi:cbb3-type cytochrome oxidase subunit 3